MVSALSEHPCDVLSLALSVNERAGNCVMGVFRTELASPRKYATGARQAENVHGRIIELDVDSNGNFSGCFLSVGDGISQRGYALPRGSVIAGIGRW